MESDELRQPLRVEPNFEQEMSDLNPDETNLRRIARASSGDYLRMEEANLLMDRIKELHERRPDTSTYELWDSFVLYFFVVGCLVLEWAGRKSLGMV